MSLVQRAQAITLRPKSEWPVIAAEPATPSGIITGYVAPLAAIGPIASAIGLAIIGIGIPFIGTYREPIVSALVSAVFTFVMILVGVAILTAIARALAPTFGGVPDTVAALKLVAYAYTPALVAGVLGLFPPLFPLELIAGLWTLYVFFLGAPALVLCAKEKALPYTATVIVCTIVLYFIAMTVFGALGIAGAGFGASRFGMGGSGSTDEAVGKAAVAQVLGSALGGGADNAQSAQKMVDAVATAGADADAAAKSGDASAQAAAGVKALSALVSGGKAPVTPVAHDALKSLLPDTAGGLARTSSEGSSGSFAGISGTSASATYGGSGAGTIELDVADLGNMAGIAAIANMGVNMQMESDGDAGYEKNVDVNGHKVHEKWTNDGKHSELMEIVDNRYAVSVSGTGVDMDTAVSALGSIDIAKLEALGAAAH